MTNRIRLRCVMAVGVALLIAGWQIEPRTAKGAEPNPLATRLEAVVVAHDRYCQAAVPRRAQNQAVDALTAQLASAPAAQRQIRGQLRQAEQAIQSALASVADARGDYTIEFRREPKYRTDRKTGKETRDGYETVKVSVPKRRTPEQKAAQISAAEARVVAARRDYQTVLDALKKFATDAREFQQQLREARKKLSEQDESTDELRRNWLAQLDFVGDWSEPEHRQLVVKCDGWLALDPLDGAARLARGLSRFRLGDPEGAQQDLDPLADVKWDSQGAAASARGLLRASQGKPSNAAADFERAIRCDSKSVSPYVCRALFACSRKEFANAIADLNAAAKIDERSSVPPRLLALIYAASPGQSNPTKALAHAQCACDLTESNDWAALDSLAAAQAAAGQFDEAVKTIDKAAGLTFADKRQQCLARKQLYEQSQQLRLDWK